MNARAFTRPESLEDRIAPAGLVIAALDEGKLTLTGGVDPTNVLIQQAGPKTWAILGRMGTLIQVGMDTPAALVFVSGISGDVTLSFGNGNDVLLFDRVVVPKNLSAFMGNGDNILEFTDSRIGGSFGYDGGTGFDGIGFSGEKVSIGKGVGLILGEGNGSFGFGADQGTIGGNVSYTGGSGSDSFSFFRGAIKITGSVNFDPGIAGSTTVDIRPRSLEVTQNLSLLDSDTGNTLIVNPLASLKVGGLLLIEAGAGVDTINVGVGTERVSVGALRVTTAPDGDADVVNIKPSGTLLVKGDLELFSNSGGILNTVSAEIIRIGRDVSVQSAAGGAATVSTLFSADSELSVGRDLLISSAADVSTAALFSGDLLKVGRTLGMGGTGTAFSNSFALRATVGGDYIASGTTGAGLNLDGTSLVVKGRLAVDSPTNSSIEADLTRLTVGRDLRMTTASGAQSLDLAVTRFLSIGGDLRLTHTGTSFDASVVAGAGRIAGNVSFDATATFVEQRLVGELAKLQIGKALALTTGAATSSDTLLSNVQVGTVTNFSSGGGIDVVRIDDSTFNGTLAISTGLNNDSVFIEQRATPSRGKTHFKGDVLVQFDLGNDVLSLAVPSGPFFNILFSKAVTFDGGGGVLDTRITSGNVLYSRSGQPSLSGFEL